MSVINLLVGASACLLPWVSPLHLYPCINNDCRWKRRSRDILHRTGIASFLFLLLWLCHSETDAENGMEFKAYSYKNTPGNNFLLSFFFTHQDSWVHQNRSTCIILMSDIQQQTGIWQWIPELCTVLYSMCRLETRCLPEAPVWNCYADKLAYESDALVPFDVMNTPKLAHFSRATSTRANQIRTSLENNNADNGLPTDLPRVILASHSFSHAFIKASIYVVAVAVRSDVWELWNANLKQRQTSLSLQGFSLELSQVTRR